jgi:hypothetical protein
LDCLSDAVRLFYLLCHAVDRHVAVCVHKLTCGGGIIIMQLNKGCHFPFNTFEYYCVGIFTTSEPCIQNPTKCTGQPPACAHIQTVSFIVSPFNIFYDLSPKHLDPKSTLASK